MSNLVGTLIPAAATTTDGISLRMMLLLVVSGVFGLGAACLGFIIHDGTRDQKLAVAVVMGCVAFCGAYAFFDDLVSTSSPTALASSASGMSDAGAMP
jgi:hypothetical protein